MTEVAPISREEAQHLQQLIRELVLTEAPTGSQPQPTTSSTSANTNAAGVPSPNTTKPQAASATTAATDASENFDQIAYTIKQIFQSGKEDAFADQLGLFVHRKEVEIEKMCNFYYQEFVQSVDQLLKVRVGTLNLKNKVVDLNGDLQSIGTKIVDKKKEVIDYRRILLNIESAMDVLQSCLFVLDIANKVNSNIENRKYYSALRLLEQLQQVHLRHISHYGFAKQMQERIPRLQEKIQEAVLQEMKEWFVRIRENTQKIGKLALEHTSVKQERIRDKRVRQARGATVSASSVNLGTSFEMVINEEDESDALNNDEIKVDFRPLHQCLHIHDVLNKRAEFTAQYEENRKLQAALVLAAKFSFKDSNLTGFQIYLHDVVGFFIVEAVILNSTENFRSRAGVEALWDASTEKMTRVIRESLQDCEDPDLFLEIKLLVLSFIHTMEGFGYAVSSLMDLMLSLLDRYAELMKLKCSERIMEIIEDDEYAPMIVNTAEEYREVIAGFHHAEAEEASQSASYPKTFPFSRGFISTCSVIKSYINGFYRFAEGFTQQYNEMDDLLKKSLENLLGQNLSGAVMRKLGSNSLSQAVQLMVNLEYFERACVEFEECLVEKRSSHKGGKVVLQATHGFSDSRLMAEKRIFDSVQHKIDDFLELADYDWVATTPQDTESPYLFDLVSFLTTVIASTLCNLPPNMKSYIYFSAFDHLATSMKNLLLQQDVERITPAFIDTFDIDIAYLEQFAAGLGDVSVGDIFAELRQTLTYLKSDNYDEFALPHVRQKKYPRVRLNNVVILLEKLKGDGSVFAKTAAADKEKKKKIENLLKNLKSQQSK
ncbi:hypothetical protein HK097_001794 [Rhizophlyctis rosea]|uniref:Exocyst complex component SEC15 n=1 Tax=Rhizophlyctis rosea TaxID=64517 RepID=A0AAD5SJ47_9FUNG|nr:hypothetical protein HK097_001794 [Rhizophlyctis rosea]